MNTRARKPAWYSKINDVIREPETPRPLAPCIMDARPSNRLLKNWPDDGGQFRERELIVGIEEPSLRERRDLMQQARELARWACEHRNNQRHQTV